jgi:hypothetical protein
MTKTETAGRSGSPNIMTSAASGVQRQSRGADSGVRLVPPARRLERRQQSLVRESAGASSGVADRTDDGHHHGATDAAADDV